MICSDFDPITSSCAPCCCVCSQRRECMKKEEAAPDATNIQSGRVEKGLPTNFSTSSLTKNKEENK